MRTTESRKGHFALPEVSGRVGSWPFEAHPQVGDQPQRHVVVTACGDRLVVALTHVRPLSGRLTVVEDGLAVEAQLDPAHDAARGTDQHVLRFLVGWRPPVVAGALKLVIPGTDRQCVANYEPAGASAPRRLQDQGAGEVPPAGRHRCPGRPEPEAAGRPIEHGAEHTATVGPGQTEPLNPSTRRDQSVDLAV